MTKFVSALMCRCLVGLAISTGIASTAAAESDAVDYNRDVWPILQAHCVGCHSDDDAEGGLNMQDFAAFAKGGEHGPAFTPGAVGSSRMIQMASGKLEPQMPPEGELPLSESQLATLSAWVEQGAIGADGEAPAAMLNTPDLPAAEASLLPTTAIAVSPVGDRVAIARFGEVEIRDPGLEKILHTMDVGEGKINALQFDDSGERLLVAGGTTGLRGRAAIYRISTGELLAEFLGHRDALFIAVFRPGGEQVATAGYDRKIIVWDVDSGQPLRTMDGHNGAVYDLAFTTDGKLLISASADETAKVWNVETGLRLDTLPQPQGEVYAIALTPDDRRIVAASADNRLRVWDLVSREQPRINPLRITRYADESPLTHVEISVDGTKLVVVSEAGNLKVLDCRTWQIIGSPQPLGDTASGLTILPDASAAVVSLMNGEVRRVALPAVTAQQPSFSGTGEVEPVYVELAPLATISEQDVALAAADHLVTYPDQPYPGLRGLSVTGVIDVDDQGHGESDVYRFRAERGEVWVVETEAASMQSPLDTIVEVLDVSDGDTLQPLIAARLQAVRDSYFTFRGKDGTQSSDFRLFAWEEMELNDMLYASGEVTKLWMYPRGPDSGFNVYPGEGNRWTYFGTSGVTHALGEPAYIVRPLAADEPAIANGLPVFEIPVANDDDPQRRRGTDSQVIFTAPHDGSFAVRVRDTRGEGGEAYRYKLIARPAAPNFTPHVTPIDKPIPPGAGRELTLKIDRIDGFEGPVQFDIQGLPPGLHVSSPVTVEAGQNQALATVWAEASLSKPEEPPSTALDVVATAWIAGRKIEHRVENAGSVAVGDPAKLTLAILPADHDVGPAENWTLTLRPGETVRARIRASRNGHEGEISLGNETAGRNAPHGVFVDNIGLSGLLITADADEREFFVTAAPITAVGKRTFFLKTSAEGGITTPPITLEVVE